MREGRGERRDDPKWGKQFFLKSGEGRREDRRSHRRGGGGFFFPQKKTPLNKAERGRRKCSNTKRGEDFPKG